ERNFTNSSNSSNNMENITLNNTSSETISTQFPTNFSLSN
ncbi:15120_t:CDS:1, partial [Gigaspora rosea]